MRLEGKTFKKCVFRNRNKSLAFYSHTQQRSWIKKDTNTIRFHSFLSHLIPIETANVITNFLIVLCKLL